ncbi:MAG: metallophosphoesterase family protein [Anaerolineae bacterium]|nr:metallophosphatase family protein [Candidatus Roseilinea sp.]MDW8450384.1 metallophosphoesterase family protein [Anaerolineae bacterium]
MSDALHPPVIELNGCRRIGVLADTHIPHRLSEMPPQVYELLRGSDAILHAGDLETTDILPPLQAIAPTYAVRGNLHWQFSTGLHDQDLPLCLTLRAGRHVIWMTHGHISFAHSLMDKFTGIGGRHSLSHINQKLIARLARLKPPEATIVVFGHSHLSCAVRLDGALYFNPGAVSTSAETRSRESPRIGRLTLHDDGRVDYDWQALSAFEMQDA